jgi:GGDEF domain-containing protein
LVSIFKAATELDRLDELQSLTQGCLARAVGLTGDHAIEVETSLAGELRRNMRALADQARTARTAEEFCTVENTFQDQLRNYQDAVQTQIRSLRKEVEGATAAVEAFARDVTGNSADYEEHLKEDLKQCEKVAQAEDIQVIRRDLREVTGKILVDCEQMQRANQLVVAQLQDEIRLLHRQVQEAHRPPAASSEAVAENSDFEPTAKIAELLGQSQAFSVLVVAVRNLPRLAAQHPPEVIESVLDIVDERTRALFGEEAVIENLNGGAFAVVLNGSQEKMASLPSETARRVSGDYTVTNLGKPLVMKLQATVGVVHHRAGADARIFCKNLEQMINALCGR